METLSIGPSPKVGEILEAVALAQVDGQVTDKNSALDFIRTQFGKK